MSAADLHAAAMAGDADAVRQAVAAGADLDALNSRGLTAAHLALGQAYRYDHATERREVSQGHKAALDALLAAGASQDIPSGAGMTLRQQAALADLPALEPPTPEAVAGDFDLWRQHADPDGWMDREAFDATPPGERVALAVEAVAPASTPRPENALEARVELLEGRVRTLQAENARLLSQRARLKDAVADLLRDDPAPKSGQKPRLKP